MRNSLLIAFFSITAPIIFVGALGLFSGKIVLAEDLKSCTPVKSVEELPLVMDQLADSMTDKTLSIEKRKSLAEATLEQINCQIEQSQNKEYSNDPVQWQLIDYQLVLMSALEFPCEPGKIESSFFTPEIEDFKIDSSMKDLSLEIAKGLCSRD